MSVYWEKGNTNPIERFNEIIPEIIEENKTYNITLVETRYNGRINDIIFKAYIEEKGE